MLEKKVINAYKSWLLVTWNHMIMYKLLVLDRNTWSFITKCKQMIIIE